MGNKVKIGASLIAAAMAVCLPFINFHEGERLQAYEDVVGVWTICHGVTIGVKPGMTKTKAECDALTKKTLARFMDQVAALLRVEVPPATLAAHTSFAYNVGINGYRSSRVLRETNAGNLRAGCQAMANWYKAGGKDCRVRTNNCYGVINRRNAEIQLCLREL